MKKTAFISFFSAILYILPLFAMGEKGDIFIGKIEFISSSRCEVIVNAESDSVIAMIAAGSILFANAGKNRIQLKVIKSDGRLIRCGFNCGKKGDAVPPEGGAVYYSLEENTASPYSDVKLLLTGLIDLYGDFIVKIESTDDPVRIASAVDEFSSSMERIIPEMDRLNKKYPELENFMTSPPPELKRIVMLLKQLEPALNDAFFKVKMFASHPDVEKSLKRLQAVLDRINGGRR